MSTLTDQRLQRFRDALAEGRIADALNQSDAANEALQDQEAVERAMRTIARGMIAKTGASSQASTTARRFIGAASDADQARIEFNIWFVAFVGGNVSAEQLLEKVDQVIDNHETVDERANQVRNQKSGVPLPLLLSLFGPDQEAVPKGSEVSIDFTLENIGARKITDIDVSVEGLDFDVTPTAIGRLAPDESASLTAFGVANQEAETQINVRAEADEVSASHQLAVLVLAKSSYIERALVDIDELKTKVEALRNTDTDVEENEIQGLLDKLTTADQQLKRILGDIEDGRKPERRINNQIDGVIKILEAFKNQVNGLIDDSQLAKERGTIFLHDSQEVIEILGAAIIAEE